MVRTLSGLGLSMIMGVSLTLLVQVVIHSRASTPVACSEVTATPQAAVPVDTTYTPQGRLLPMPRTGRE
jgi:hypothetical protein